MKFTGRNLALIERAIELAIAELGNQIGTCPDVFLYAESLGELEDERDVYTNMLARIQG